MATITGPLFGLDARGTIGSALTYSYWRGVNYVRSRVIPANPNSSLQQAIRSLITDATQAWKNEDSPIDSAYKSAYDTAAEGQKYSGFNLFIKDAVGKNEGSSYSAPFEAPTEPGDNSPE
jgi:hypothetical protein